LAAAGSTVVVSAAALTVSGIPSGISGSSLLGDTALAGNQPTVTASHAGQADSAAAMRVAGRSARMAYALSAKGQALAAQQAAAGRAAARRAAARAAARQRARLAAEQRAQQQAAQRQAQQQQQAAAPSGSPQQIAMSMLGSFGWSSSQFSCLDSLWNEESGWNVTATNPSSGAYGIPQALPGSKMASAGADWQTDAATQIKWGLEYIQSTYGSPCGAWAHEEADGWY
jgi:hypothetical protein